MKVISIWQPYASLTVHNHKFIETRGWPAPKSIIGERIGIAATKIIRPEQKAAYQDDEFQRHYSATGMPPLEELPMGCILGSVVVHSCEMMDDELIEGITSEERAFGDYAVGRYAWRLRYPVAFDRPVTARGAQGLWEWNSHDLHAQTAEGAYTPRPPRSRDHLHVVKR